MSVCIMDFFLKCTIFIFGADFGPRKSGKSSIYLRITLFSIVNGRLPNPVSLRLKKVIFEGLRGPQHFYIVSVCSLGHKSVFVLWIFFRSRFSENYGSVFKAVKGTGLGRP